jgi:Protein of unknown function (DUF2752)
MKSKPVRKIYLFTCIVMLSLFLFEYWVYHTTLGPPATTCFFIVLFGLPCAVCGGSHAIKSLLHGQVLAAISFNILTTLIFFFHIIFSVILLYDFLFSSNQFLKMYYLIRSKLEKKNIRYGLALFLFCCWMVNVFKYYPK